MFKRSEEHTRVYPFRPKYDQPKDVDSDWELYKRFFIKYLMPQKWVFLLSLLIISINESSVYVLGFYNRLVVDNILVIKSEKENTGGKRRIWEPDREKFGKPSRPVVSMGRRIDMGHKVSPREPEAGRHLFKIGLMYILTLCFLNTLGRISARLHILIAQAISGHIRDEVHAKVLELSTSFHQSMNPGRLMSRILSDTVAVRQEMMGLFMSGTSCTSKIVVGVGILLYQDWRVALIALAVLPVYGMLFKRKRPLIRHLNQEIRHTHACLYGMVNQKIEAMKAIQAYAREAGEKLNFHRVMGVAIRDSMTLQHNNATLGQEANVLVGISGAIILLYGGKLVLDGELTLGVVMFLHSTTMQLFVPVIEFTQLPFVVQRMRIALHRVDTILSKKVEIADAPNAVDFPAPLKKGIEIRDVFFTYPMSQYSRKDEEMSQPVQNPPVLRGINLFVPVGNWLCIMGASGSGKSTLLSLLARLYDPTVGSILIDGINLKNIKLDSLRRRVGVVPQEAQIFAGSLRDNICYGLPDATNKQILDASKEAQMHDFIMEMKAKYETLVEQRGSSLSGGQRQRLSLARALLTSPEVLILDDCTSALDANTERKIQETLAEVLVGRTAIMVSQRVSMAMRCHKIAVIENGMITEYGTHHELLEKNGFYAKLFHQQTE